MVRRFDSLGYIRCDSVAGMPQRGRRGRGGALAPSPVKAAAQTLGLPVSHDPADATGVGADLGVVERDNELLINKWQLPPRFMYPDPAPAYHRLLIERALA